MQDIVMQPIGYVRNSVQDKKDTAWGADISTIELDEEYLYGLTGLESFSHALIVTYLDQANYRKEKHLLRRPQGREDMPVVGIFSQRTKDRPNRLGITAVEILSVGENTLQIKGLDAIDGTPILDIKPYFPAFDKRNARTPEWVDILMENYF